MGATSGAGTDFYWVLNLLFVCSVLWFIVLTFCSLSFDLLFSFFWPYVLQFMASDYLISILKLFLHLN